MGLNCGIVGLPNVGKSTIFSALTSAPAEAANYPFCTIDPNVGMVNVPDDRLYGIADIVRPKQIIPAITEFVDIAGLVKGASQGEGLGNQFLSHIRQVGVIIHVVRCFDNPDIIHVTDKVDPRSDIETIHVELALADLDTVDKRIEKNVRNLKSPNRDIAKQAQMLEGLLNEVRAVLQQGKPARIIPMTDDRKRMLYDLHLITMKRQLYVCNVDDDGLQDGNGYVEIVKDIAASEGAEALSICGKLEAEIASLETAGERKEFLAEAGLEESGLVKLIRAAYRMLGLRTFFTAGEKEARAWTFHDGDRAPQAAGIIHTDFERGFIKAEVYHYDDLLAYGSEQKVREAGKLRIEGKEYVVADGDIMHFKFNV